MSDPAPKAGTPLSHQLLVTIVGVVLAAILGVIAWYFEKSLDERSKTPPPIAQVEKPQPTNQPSRGEAPHPKPAPNRSQAPGPKNGEELFDIKVVVARNARRETFMIDGKGAIIVDEDPKYTTLRVRAGEHQLAGIIGEKQCARNFSVPLGKGQDFINWECGQ